MVIISVEPSLCSMVLLELVTELNLRTPDWLSKGLAAGSARQNSMRIVVWYRRSDESASSAQAAEAAEFIS
jgi:hypothetical protein